MKEHLYQFMSRGHSNLDSGSISASSREELHRLRRKGELPRSFMMLSVFLFASGSRIHGLTGCRRSIARDPTSRGLSPGIGGPSTGKYRTVGDQSRRALLSTISLGLMIGGSAPSLASEKLQFDGQKFVPPPQRDGLKAKWLENVRIYLQDEADNIQYGGELAPGGAPPATWLQLVPIVQLQAKFLKMEPLLADRARWDDLLTTLDSDSFTKIEIGKIFNAYSDNIYYASDTQEANVGLLGGTTPSSGQSMQYLYRNEALSQIDELRSEIKYQKNLAADELEPDVLKKIYAAVLGAFSDYLQLAPSEQLKKASEAVYGSYVAAK